MMIVFVVYLCLVGVYGKNQYSLPGECPDVKVQEDLNFTRFSGHWYIAGAYASEERNIHDCGTLELEEDNMVYNWKETYVIVDGGNRTQMTYLATLYANINAGDSRPQFIVNDKVGDSVLQYPFYILSTDYDHYAVAYYCEWIKEKIRTHYVYTWVLTRSKDKLQGEVLKNVDDTISRYPNLAEHRQAFVFKEFSEATCAYTNKAHAEYHTNYFS